MMVFFFSIENIFIEEKLEVCVDCKVKSWIGGWLDGWKK